MKTRLLLPALVLLPFAGFAVSQPSATFPATGNGLAQPVATAVDAVGNVVVTGVGYPAGKGSDFVTAKFGPAGALIWVKTYGGAANSYDEPKSLVLDAAGNVYVAGISRGSGKGNDYATVKYGPDGQELWVARYDSGKNDAVTALGLGADGAVYVTGHTDAEGGRPIDYDTVKYSAAGAQLGVLRLEAVDTEQFDATGPAAVTADAAGNVFLAGAASALGENLDFTVLKLDAAGQEVGHFRFGGPDGAQDLPTALALAADGSVTVAGSSSISGGAANVLVVRFGATGAPLWSSRSPLANRVAALHVGNGGNVTVAAAAQKAGSPAQLVTLKFLSTGTRALAVAEDLGEGIAAAQSSIPGEGVTLTLRQAAGTAPQFATFRTPTTSSSAAPVIVAGPVGLSAVVGENVQFSVQAENAAGFQWHRNGEPIAGATGATLTLNAVQRAQSGDYSVEVSNSLASVVTAGARLSFDDTLTGFTVAADRTAKFRLFGEPKRIYHLQSSTGLGEWSTLALLHPDAYPVDLQDKPATDTTARFYRTVRLP